MKSPGIPEKAPIVKKLTENGIPVISEIEFAIQFTDATTVGITGSNGKTTTTLLTYHLLKQGGLNVGLAGNIGKSFAWQVAENKHDIYVLELSSFQLDGIINYKPHIAIITNISPDHLDRYNYDYNLYIDSKFRITKNQTEADYLIYDNEDEAIQKQIDKLEATKTANSAENKKAEPQKELIQFEDFAKMDIRVGTILEAEKMPKANKLLILKVDTGIDVRTIVSGIAESFKPEDIIGKRVTVLVNLAPRNLRGVESQGMILMTSNAEGKLVFVNPDVEGVANGETIN